MALNPENFAGVVFTGEIAGMRIAATHGHLADILDDLIDAGPYDYVFHGHTHRMRDEMISSVRVINPGALGGTRYEPRSICILDLVTGEVEFVEIAGF